MMLRLRAFCIPVDRPFIHSALPRISHGTVKLDAIRSPFQPFELIRNRRRCRRGRNPAKIPSSQIVCFKDNESSSCPDDNSVLKDGSPSVAPESTSISCTTFNILAPIYKRVNGEDCRESQFPDCWIRRNSRILDLLLVKNSSIICLQEFWLENQELVALYESNLHGSGYQTYTLARTNDRGDGLLTAIKSEKLKVLDCKELYFNDCGDRVAQLFHIQTKPSFFQMGQNSMLDVLLVNTHLIFPHDFNYCLIRLRQVYKILECVEQFKTENGMKSMPVILCGDWNGSKRGRVYQFLRSQGYVSSFDAAHAYTDSDVRRWVSHLNHRGDTCEVDFIWLLNPGIQQKPLSVSWNEAMLGTIKAKLRQAGLTGREAFNFFQSKSSDNVLTLQDLQEGLTELGLTDAYQEGFTGLEIKQVMQMIDLDGNGVIDNDEFKKSISTSASLGVNLQNPNGRFQELNRDEDLEEDADVLQGLNIKDASLFPPEAEVGVWPEDYSLSDHAALTVTFTSMKRQEEMPMRCGKQ